MVDSGYLKQDDVVDIKEAKAVDDFYFVLLRDTYSNMNRLRAKGLNNKDAVALSLKEMADELLSSGLDNNLTQRLNNCGDNQSCIDKVLEEVSSGLLIEQDEARDIAILQGKPFITKWKTDNNGVSASNQISIPTIGNGYKYDIVWGDGTNNRDVIEDITHSYPEDGNYTVEIYGEFPQIYFAKEGTDSKKVVSIIKWGDIEWKSMDSAFFGCSNLKGEANDIPNLSKVTKLDSMFNGASLFNQDISDWNVSTVTSMKDMFSNATAFNQNLENWDISNVTDMSGIFTGLTLSLENYDSLLIGWSSKTPQRGVTLDAGSSQYSSISEVQRTKLVNSYGWNILDGGCDGSCAVYENYGY
ncbi:MAG TPA: BspA family leucine-rich repeat surface protein [Campylobacterales bacterium]|nr:BspA family leucine-rich repeat surface protein [Campylobacterales bacterium]